MRTNKPKTRILVDGGDPDETSRVKKLIGFVDGQTTNPSLIAKNLEVQRLLASGQRMTPQQQKKRVQENRPTNFSTRPRFRRID
jgi:transaldolase